jgi:hypothetical protein
VQTVQTVQTVQAEARPPAFAPEEPIGSVDASLADADLGEAAATGTLAAGDVIVDAAAENGGLPAVRIIEAELARGQSLANSMAQQDVSPRVVHHIAMEMIGHFDFRRSQPGHRYRLVLDPEGRIESFIYRTSPTVHYQLVRDADLRLSVDRVEAVLEPRQTMIAGVVTSSLYGAITELGGAAQLASDFSDVFAYDVDFSRVVRSGDEFRILFERLYRTDEHGDDIFVRPGRILAASYGGSGGEHLALYYESEEGHAGYYRPDGSAVERQFLRAPLRYSRISSRYSSARRHPILKVTRPHHGIDYAAPHGTPVYAVSPGHVIHKNWAGGFGRLVKIEHEDGYVSYYAHLSRFASGLQKGDQVSQKQVIGYVGSSGLATGPHVCFRVAKDGRYVNPTRLPSPAGPPLPPEHQQNFRAHRDTLLAALDSGRLVTVDEAL